MHVQKLLDDLFIVVFTIGESVIVVSLIRERRRRRHKGERRHKVRVANGAASRRE